MPGVHIHKIGQFDWIEQQKESILTVPGSYWLCHKNNVYKFTLKYHRSYRNTKEFTYGKELMKVIRRIIKSYPRQGQQFCTKHILVTYNHTTWTRQDKMFAILKFREHTEATTVTRAIVLTVKILKNENSMLETEQHTIVPLRHIKKDYSKKDTVNDSKVVVGSSDTDELKINYTDPRKYINNFNSNYNSSTSNLLIRINDSDKHQVTRHNRDSTNNISSEISTTESSVSTSVNIENKNTHASEDRLVPFQEEEIGKNEAQGNCNNSHDDPSIANDEGIVDSANLPYQYLIEKEIENAKKKIVYIPLLDVGKSSPVDIKYELSGNSTMKRENKHIKRTVEEDEYDKDCTKQQMVVTTQDGQEEHKDMKCTSTSSKEWESSSKCKSIGEPEKTMISEDSTAKSSNITDLIMKGRMFTIQQDQDSVSVLEQKTKTDVDEVLENSEKVETKEGEKCLLNSSLLKLENLVTMIETPKENLTSNCRNKILPSAKDTVISQYVAESTCTIDPFAFPFDSQKISTSNESFYESIIRNEGYEAKERNIISQIQQLNNESKSLMVEASNSCKIIYSKDRLETNDELILASNDLHSTELKQTNGSLDQNKTVLENSVRNSKSEIAGTIAHAIPKIISNQIITVDQMPLALQNIVKKKLLKSNASKNNTPKSNPQNARLYSVELKLSNQTANPEVESTSDIDGLSKRSNVEVAKEIAMSSKKRKRPYDRVTKKNNVKINNNDIISSNGERICSSVDKTERHKRRKKQQNREYDRDEKVSVNISNVVKRKYSHIPNKLQDITEEFYKDLMHHRTYNTTVDRKSQRQTRGSLYLHRHVKNENIRIEMLKFIENITKGVKVVVNRLSTKSISGILGKSSSLAYVN